MRLSGAGDYGVARPEVPLLISDREAAGAFEDIVDFVRCLVGVDLLALSRKQAVGIVEQMRGVEEAVLLHLLLREGYGLPYGLALQAIPPVVGRVSL